MSSPTPARRARPRLAAVAAACLAVALATPPPALAQDERAPSAAPVPAPADAPAAPADAPPAPADAPADPAPPAPAEAPAAEAPPPGPSAADGQAAAVAAGLAHPDLDARTRFELELLQRINALRAEHGRGALLLDDRLVAAARQHAVDMAYRNFCRHTGSDGSRARQRLARNGYPYNNWAGENILCARRSADAALAWWLSSPPHRANLLHGHFTHIGVGVSMLGTYGPDLVLTFAAGDDATAEPGVFAALRGGDVAGWIAATREPDQRPR